MITNVGLYNFRSHEKTEMALAPRLNLWQGPLGAGKSSVCHAIALTFTGQNPIVNAKGEGLRRETRIGTDQYQIAVKTDQGTLLQRKVTKAQHTLAIDGEWGTVSAVQGRIFERFHCNLEVILALLDPRQFFSRDEKTQRKTLLQFMASQEVEAPAVVKKLGLAQSFTTASQIDALIKEVKDVRIRDLNRDVRELQAKIEGPVTVKGDRTALEVALKNLRPGRDAVIRKQSAEEEWRKTLASLEERAKAAPNVVELQGKLQAIEAQEAGLQSSVEAKRREYTRKKGAVEEGRQQLTKLTAEARHLEITLSTIGGMGEKCGVVDVFDCPLHKKDRDKMVVSLKGKFEDAQKGQKAVKAVLDDAEKDLLDIQTSGNEAVKSLSAATSQIADLKAQMSGAQEVAKQLEGHRTAKPSTGDWPKELADVSGKIAAAETSLVELNRQAEQASQRAIQVAEVQTKQMQAQELAQAVEELGTLKDKLLTGASAGFTDVMREFVKNFGFSKVEFSLDPLGFILDGIFPDQLSGGQRVILEAALRVAAAKQSGFEILAMDDVNIGEATRPKLRKLLYESGVQVILVETTDVRPPAAKAVNGCRMMWFSNPSTIGPTKVEEIG